VYLLAATGLDLPTPQIAIFFTALGLRAFRVRDMTILGFSLHGWGVPPECIVWSMLVGLLIVQQIRWEKEWKAPGEKEAQD